MKPFVLVAVLAAAMLPASVRAQSADTILVNGKVIALGGRSSVAQGIAIRDGRILETGANEDVRKRADAHTKVIDLGGRTVIPGLMDSHIHALRAGLTYSVELSWIGVPSLAQGLDLIREAARTAAPGTWIKIGGGWTELQFAEKRGPTVAELVAAAPDRPVYVQRLYNTAWITLAGMKLMNLTPTTEIPGGKAEKDAGGNLTGVFTGVNRTFNFFTAKIPGPRIEDQYAGTKKYFRELNRLGMTAINDFPGGGMLPEHFNAVQQLWQKGEQTLRVTFHISGDTLAEYKALTAFTPMNFGDDWLHFRGIGESLTRGIYDGSTVGLPYDPSDKDRAEFCAVAKWAAEQDLNVHQHAASEISRSGHSGELRVATLAPIAGMARPPRLDRGTFTEPRSGPPP
jgi:predicted amidohydrolase YtcJ